MARLQPRVCKIDFCRASVISPSGGPSPRPSHRPAGRSAYRSFILLRKLPLFDNMELACLEDVASRLEPVKAPAGEHIVRAGEPGDCMYFISAGAVQVGESGCGGGVLNTDQKLAEEALREGGMATCL